MVQREIDKKTEQRNYDNTMREIQRLENVVEQQRRWGREKNIKTAESKMKVIERLEKDLNAPMQSPEEMEFTFKPVQAADKMLFRRKAWVWHLIITDCFQMLICLLKRAKRYSF